MKKYISSVELDNKLEEIEFETKDNPIEYLWQRYGMSCYIEYVKLKEDVEEE